MRMTTDSLLACTTISELERPDMNDNAGALTASDAFGRPLDPCFRTTSFFKAVKSPTVSLMAVDLVRLR